MNPLRYTFEYWFEGNFSKFSLYAYSEEEAIRRTKRLYLAKLIGGGEDTTLRGKVHWFARWIASAKMRLK